MGRISINFRYVIDIIGMDPFSFKELGEGVNLEKLGELRYF